MKTILTVVAIVVIVGLKMSLTAQAHTSNTACMNCHNLHGTGGVGHSNFGCALCHVPHNAKAGDVPLWNPSVPDGSINFSTGYSSTTMDAAVGAPNGSSKLCLGCHDGAYTGAHAPSTINTFSSSGGSGGMGAFTSSHPISFVYDTALANADGELQDPTASPSVRVLLDSGSRMQCVSCHEAHISPHSRFLRMEYKGTSQTFCRTCHIK